MRQDLDDVFGGPLVGDPSIALPGNVIGTVEKPGPLHRVEFVVELVGQASVPAHAAARLLDYDWHSALDNPRAWSMRSSDTSWQRLIATKDGSFDSLAMSWPIIRANGNIGTRRARELYDFATQFGEAIGRRAAPFPPAEDVDRLAADLDEIHRGLDVGVGIYFVPSRGRISERDVWRTCASLGMEFEPAGSFAWKARNARQPLFEITPIGTYESFSLGNAKADAQHEGLLFGFNVPLSPQPARAIEGLLRSGRHFCEKFGGRLIDDSDRFVDAATAGQIIREVTSAIEHLTQAKVAPGSSEARLLFDLDE